MTKSEFLQFLYHKDIRITNEQQVTDILIIAKSLGLDFPYYSCNAIFMEGIERRGSVIGYLDRNVAWNRESYYHNDIDADVVIDKFYNEVI